MILTVAPDMTPPVWSATVPRMRPKLPCENSGTENSNTPSEANSRNVILLVRRKKDARNTEVLELIVSPLRKFEWPVDPTTGQETTDGKRLLCLRGKVKG
jgi:hypothetical protein